jgi:nicotinamidase-related amidase
MSSSPLDLHGSVPDTADTCLLIIDMINAFTFDDAEKLFPAVVQAADRIARLKQRAAAAHVPTIYVNDNFGKWRHDFHKLVEHCLKTQCRGKPVAERLRPTEDDYFVLKPKHSGFFATPLELLLKFLRTRRLILTGVAGDNCVLYTAADAYMRDFAICVPGDCIVSIDVQSNQAALDHMKTTLKADILPSTAVRLEQADGNSG